MIVLAQFVRQASEWDTAVTLLISVPFVLALFAIVTLLLRRLQ